MDHPSPPSTLPEPSPPAVPARAGILSSRHIITSLIAASVLMSSLSLLIALRNARSDAERRLQSEKMDAILDEMTNEHRKRFNAALHRMDEMVESQRKAQGK